MDQKIESRDAQGARGEFTLRDLFVEIWASRVSLTIVVALFSIGGVSLGLLVTRKYQATVVMFPAATQAAAGLGGLGSLANRYGGLASLMGISLPKGSRAVQAIAVLQSQLLTRRFIRENNLLPILYADRWDPVARKWKASNPKKRPSLWKANRFFARKIRQVIQNRNGLITLRITWTDPKQAADWANGLVALANGYLRKKAIAEAQRDITYLDQEALKTNVLDAREVIYSLMQSEIDKEMVARGRPEYALRVIDPAYVPEKPSSAGPLLLGVLGFGLGCMAAFLIALGKRIFVV